MFGKTKHKVLNWSVIFSALLFISCNTKKPLGYYKLTGNTQGTTYTILSNQEADYFVRDSIDSILHDFDMALSTYIDSSLISKLNNSVSGFTGVDSFGYFENCYNKSQFVYEASKGAFDPSVYPLILGWGFMKNMATPLSADSVQTLLADVGFEKKSLHTIRFSDSVFYEKSRPNFRLDFNAIAQGYSVDVLFDYLYQRGMRDFYVEIGGEIRVDGKNFESKDWRIGIDFPSDTIAERSLENIVNLSNKSIATSGNYRKYYIKDGRKYAHTIDPKTGFPVEHNLLSATVVTDQCGLADAYATVLMVLGVEGTKKWFDENPDLNFEYYLLYQNEDGSIERSMSDGFNAFFDH